MGSVTPTDVGRSWWYEWTPAAIVLVVVALLIAATIGGLLGDKEAQQLCNAHCSPLPGVVKCNVCYCQGAGTPVETLGDKRTVTEKELRHGY